MALIRFTAEAIGSTRFGNLKFFARQMSALADLFTIFVLYLIVSGFYGRRIGLFTAAFSALTVMQIQQSHFFTTDLFTNLFMFLAILFAVAIAEAGTGYHWNQRMDQIVSKLKFRILSHPFPFVAEHWLWIYAWLGDGIQDQCGGAGAHAAGRVSS